LIKHFDYVIDYHLGKINVIINAPSHKNKAIMETMKEGGEKELMELKKINVKIEIGPEGSLFGSVKSMILTSR